MKRVSLIIFLFIILAYVANITGIPDTIVIFKGEELNLGEIFGIYINEENSNEQAIQTFRTLNDIETVEKSTVKLRLFNIIDLKEVKVSTIPTTRIIPIRKYNSDLNFIRMVF